MRFMPTDRYRLKPLLVPAAHIQLSPRTRSREGNEKAEVAEYI